MDILLYNKKPERNLSVYCLLLENGAIFTVGSNTHGQLGYETPSSDASHPQVVSVLATHWIRHVACGDTFTVAATNGEPTRP